MRELCELARTLHALGRTQEALEVHELVLAHQPDHLESLNNRGVALQRLGRLDDALASFERALELRPDHAEALNNRGAVLKTQGRLEAALDSFDRALVASASPLALNNRANVLRELGRAAEALRDHDLSLKAQPNFAEAWADRALTLWRLGRLAEALESCDTALALDPNQAEVLNHRGLVLLDLNRPDEGLQSLDAALAVAPDHVEALTNRATLLTELGRPKEARASAERALALDPACARAWYALTLCTRATSGWPALDAMRALAERAGELTADDRIHLHYALAKALEDLGDAAGAWAHLSEGSRLKRATLDYDEAATLAFLASVRSAFSQEALRGRAGAGCPSPAPVFIVGMPRSGSTLVEQILAGHPAVHTAGETDHLPDALVRRGLRTASLPAWSDWLAQLQADDLAAIGADYVGRLAADAPASAARILDKGLGNFQLLGLIHLALPNARIVHVRRDPLDTCVSCYSKLFGRGLGFTYELGELGRYHAAYERLMAHWRAVLPAGTMLEVRYEDVVDDLEGQARRLLDHCGLDWDARCLEFQDLKRWIHTASAAQVRQPLYRTAIGRWRAFEPWLGPLVEALGS